MPKLGILESKSIFYVIYRSSKCDQTYLYVEKKDDLSRVPKELTKGFGQSQLAMILPLDGRKELVNADIRKAKQTLTEQGYYLQLPLPPEDLLKQHLSVMGQKTDDMNKQLISGGGIISVGVGSYIHGKVRGTLCINITAGKVRCWIIR